MTRVFVVTCALTALAACTGEAPRARAPEPSPQLQGFVPPFFPAAQGESRYLRRDARGVAELTRDGMRLALRGAEKTIHWGLVGARAVEPRAEGLLEGRINFFVGDRSRWRTDLPTFSRLVYEGVYPGIDLVLESREGGVEYTLEVAPGADLSPVRFRYEGVEVAPRADGSGLELRAGSASLREEGLRCFQGERPLGARYARVRPTAGGAEYGLQLDHFDASARVVIDPAILWGSFAGGTAWDEARAVAVDANRNVILAGYTQSSDFPRVSPIDNTFGGSSDAFVMKIHPLGSSLLWATFLGGTTGDSANGVAVDPAGDIYVVGTTTSADFPSTGGFDATLGGSGDGFITKIAASGSALLWSSYLGGSGDENAWAVASDGVGAVYVAGQTRSTDFPVPGGFDATLGGSLDAFVTKVGSNGSVLWSSYLGGSAFIGDDVAYAVAVDGSGDAYVAGYTQSTDFPVPGGFQTTFGGGSDGFVTKVDALGAGVVWSTFVGGTDSDYGVQGLAVDASGNAYGAITTESTDIPIVGGFDGTLDGLQDVYVFKIASGGSTLAWSTYLGGSSNDTAAGVAVDGSGNVYVAGTSFSTNFPTTGGFDTSLSGTQDAFVAEIAAAGTSLVWGSYLGGNADDFANDMTIDGAGSLYVTGGTTSSNFPATGGFDTTYGGFGTFDGFVAKIVSDPTAPVAGVVSDGLGVDIDFQSTSATLSANWTAFSDPETGIAGYEWGFGTSPGSTGVQPFTSVGLATSATSTGLTLNNGSTYYVTVRATNGVGAARTATSDGVRVDTTPPNNGLVFDGTVTGFDEDYQGSLTTISATWSGFGDIQSGITGYEWAIGTTPTGTDLQPYTSVGLATSASNGSLSLVEGGRYYVRVRATNGAGLTASGSSDGVTVDTSPPTAGTANDGLTAGVDVDAQTSTTTIAANWSGFADPQSGISGYAWAIGTSPGSINVQGYVGVGSSTVASNNTLSLTRGTTYYVTVRGLSGAGATVFATTDGVVVDDTAPVAGTVNDGPGADVDVQGSTTTISANWSGYSDAESGISRYEWAIGTSVGGTQVQAFTSVGTATSASATGLALSPAPTYYVTVRATNGSGLTVSRSSDGVRVDTSPPISGVVRDGVTAPDVDAQSSTTTLSANWISFSDGESGLAGYEWAIGTTPGGQEVQAFTSVGLASSASTGGLTLASGTTYYVTVRVTNGAGLTSTATSDGVLVDATPPVAGTVNDGAGADVRYQTSTTTITANWSAFTDAETGVSGYAWAIGTSPGASDVMAFTSLGVATSASQGGLSLTSGVTYYVTVRGDNAAGLTTTASSDGVTVDTTPPSTGSVADGPSADVDFQASLTRIDANWSGFADAESGIADYEWAIGTAPGGTNVQGFTSVGTATSASNASLPLASGTIYYVTVRVTCGAGLSSTATSDGVKVDASPPVAGTVNDGAGADIDTQTSTTALSANWSAFVDVDSGVTGYSWGIGTTPGASDVQAFTGVGSATSASASGLSLSGGTTYYVTVRATNGAGLAAAVTSDGVFVTLSDTTEPFAGTVNDGAGADIDTQTSTTTLAANWSGFRDPESGIARYEWAIGTSPAAADVQAFTDVGTATGASASGLSLTGGTAYYVTVRVTNGVGLFIMMSSDGVIVTVPDATPPIAGLVNDGQGADIDTQTSTTTIYANWSGFSDPESGIARYDVAIGTTPGGTDVQAFFTTSTNTSGLFGAQLVVGTTYYVTVRATNGNALTTTATSDGVTVNTVAPQQPTATPTSIDFGMVSVGESSSAHQVAVQNASATTWSVTSVVSDNPEFVLDTAGFPSSLAPGQTATLGLTFHPVAAGLRTGLLKISFAGSAAPTSVSLSGTGVAQEPPGGCGCTSGSGGPAAAALLALALGLRRRALRTTR